MSLLSATKLNFCLDLVILNLQA